MLFFPILLILTPSPSKSTQSILYALSAPVRVGPLKSAVPLQPIQPLQPGENTDKKAVEEEVVDPRRSGVGGGDVIRDCAVIEYVLLLFYHPLPLHDLPFACTIMPPLLLSCLLFYHASSSVIPPLLLSTLHFHSLCSIINYDQSTALPSPIPTTHQRNSIHKNIS
jgi:hypothetical protein